ncbi:unnamed protein product [Rotaria sp. Silwood2]|nr:unnamed protein product [Rotaria sp. Silwood2]
MLFSIIILLYLIQPSYQVVYACNSKAVCGCSLNPVSITRIVGGENASEASWGWAVSISINETFLCGGSILSSSWIITAAHCVENFIASQFIIYAGSTLVWSGTQNRSVAQIIVHPSYDSVTYINDIALLRLASPLMMSDPNVSPICVPSVSSTILASDEFPTNGITVVAIGWGSLFENGQVSTTLQQVALTIIDYESLTCSPLIVDQNTQVCAGMSGGGKDTCQGDSGGPLMMFTSTNQWVLVGLTSFGYGCARPLYAGVYTRVAAYESWIRSNTNDSYWFMILSHAHSMKSSIYSLLFFVWLSFLLNYTPE